MKKNENKKEHRDVTPYRNSSYNILIHYEFKFEIMYFFPIFTSNLNNINIFDQIFEYISGSFQLSRINSDWASCACWLRINIRERVRAGALECASANFVRLCEIFICLTRSEWGVEQKINKGSIIIEKAEPWNNRAGAKQFPRPGSFEWKPPLAKVFRACRERRGKEGGS